MELARLKDARVDKSEANLAALEQELVALNQERDRHAQTATDRERDLDAAAEDSKRFGELGRQRDDHRREVDRLSRLIIKREAERQAKRGELAQARLAAAIERWKAMLADRNKAAKAFLEAPTRETLRTLEQARVGADEARAAVAELGDPPMPEEEDEPDWPEHASQVAEALAPGPRQPRRRSAEGLAKQ